MRPERRRHRAIVSRGWRHPSGWVRARPRSRRRRRSAPPCRDRHPGCRAAKTSRAAPLAVASPPRMASTGACARPASSGNTLNSRISPCCRATTRFSPATVSSSRPWPCTSHTSVLPRLARVSTIGRAQLGSNTPVSWRRTEAGLASGPRRLNIVRVPSSTLGPAAWRRAAWWRGAKRNTQCAARRMAGRRSIGTSTFTPSVASTSAPTVRLLRARLPCLATGTPRPASTKVTAVETFNVPAWSPPVPQTSIAPGGALRRAACGCEWRARRR